ncbi:MAG: hypothetical protein ACXWHZ_07075 [Usitatibacter sp.]
MGVALYIVLDKEDAGFDTFVNGKTIAKEEKRLDAISKHLGIPRFSDFISMSTEELEGILGDVEISEQDVKWFTADEGLSFVQALAAHIRANPSAVKNQSAVIEDLTEYVEVFEKAKAVGAKWHLNFDI